MKDLNLSGPFFLSERSVFCGSALKPPFCAVLCRFEHAERFKVGADILREITVHNVQRRAAVQSAGA